MSNIINTILSLLSKSPLSVYKAKNTLFRGALGSYKRREEILHRGMESFQKPGNRALEEVQIIKHLPSGYPKSFIAVVIQVQQDGTLCPST